MYITYIYNHQTGLASVPRGTAADFAACTSEALEAFNRRARGPPPHLATPKFSTLVVAGINFGPFGNFDSNGLFCTCL